MTTAVSTSVCVNPTCQQLIRTTARWREIGGGLCRKCAGSADRVERSCQDCKRKFNEYPKFLRAVGAFAGKRTRCPGCHDKAVGKEEKDTVRERECLAYFPLVRVSDFDFENATLCETHGVSGRPPRRAHLKDRENKSYTGQFTVYDYRPDGCRGLGSLASVRIMRVEHAGGVQKTVMSGAPMGRKYRETLKFDPEFTYMVLEEPSTEVLGMEPEVQLVCAEIRAKWNQNGAVVADDSLFSVTLSSQSRSGRHSHQTVLALVGDEHPLIYQQDHLKFRRGNGNAELEEAAFRGDPGVSLSILLPGGDVMLADKYGRQGWRVRLVEAGVVIRPQRDENDPSRYRIPDDLEGAILQLVASEEGGGYSNTGWASCVAALDGSRLTPLATAGSRGDLACKTHGWFAATDGIMIAECTWWNKATPSKTVKLTRHVVSVEGAGLVSVTAESLYQGEVSEIPNELVAFVPLVEATSRKASDYHCRSLCFSS